MEQIGWYPFRVQAGVASTCLNIGHMVNVLTLMNEDSTNTIWFRVGGTPQTAAASATGASASFPLAPGESITLWGVQVRYIAYLASAGTPWFKGLGYIATGQVHGA